VKYFVLLFFLCACFASLANATGDTTSNPTLFDAFLQTAPAPLQDTSETENEPSKKKVGLIAGVHAAGYAGTLLLLSQAWYKNHNRTSFHTFNDSKEWLQVDKAGHAWTAYNIANYSRNLWLWAGVPQKKAAVLGGVSSVGYQTILEYLDGHSESWGWSWTDMGANVFGSALFVSQELAWGDQRINMKFSSHLIQYPNDLKDRSRELFGTAAPQRILKDYNAQTYWLSANLASFLPKMGAPNWLNVAVGYGAQGLFGGFENKNYNKEGALIFNREDIARQRQWYLSPDVDFTKIKTGKKGVKMLFSLLNMVKLPAPALELSNNKLKAHLLFF